MGKSQRTKGAVYEREVMQAFSDALGQDFKRNIGQARDGGNDGDVGPLVLEMKRRKNLKTIEGWFAQAKAAALGRAHQPAVPVVVARADQGESFVLIRLTDFMWLTRERLLHNIAWGAKV
jgi:hypothetical protein